MCGLAASKGLIESSVVLGNAPEVYAAFQIIEKLRDIQGSDPRPTLFKQSDRSLPRLPRLK